MEKIKYKDIPFKYPDPCSDDMWFSVFVKGDKITIESIIDRCRGRSRETAYIKMKGNKIWLKTIEDEYQDSYYQNGFKSIHTVRNGKYVDELPRYIYDDKYMLNDYLLDKEESKKRAGKETKWRIPYRFLDYHSIVYLILKIQGKEKAERYANRIIKKLNTEKLQKYNEEVSDMCKEHKAERGYREDFGCFGIINRKTLGDKKLQEIYKLKDKIGEKYGYEDSHFGADYTLGMIDEIKQVIEYGNLKFFLKQKKSESFEEMAKDYAEYEKKKNQRRKKKNVFNPD